MKRVLLITYFYPPRPGMGSVRTGGLAKYLAEFGWEPIVLTPKLPDGPRPTANVVETGFRDVLGAWKERLGLDGVKGLHEQFGLPESSIARSQCFHTRVLERTKSIIAYPDPMKGWIPFAMEAIKGLAQGEKPAAILTSAPPVSCHLIGRRAKEILTCRWVADFRDLWTQNPYYPYGLGRRVMEERLERNTLKTADILVTVSLPLAELLRERYPSQVVASVTNGFDPDDISPEDLGLTKNFSITYTGQLYSGKRDPSLLFEVTAELIKEAILPHSGVCIRFYGRPEPWLPAMVHDHGLNATVELHGPVPRDAALRHQRESQILLLLGCDNPSEAGVYTGKIFEYLGSRRPILAVGGPPGVVSDILEETKAGVHAVSKAGLRDFLIQSYSAFRTGGEVPYSGNDVAIQRYTHREMARKFAALLDSLQGNPKK